MANWNEFYIISYNVVIYKVNKHMLWLYIYSEWISNIVGKMCTVEICDN